MRNELPKWEEIASIAKVKFNRLHYVMNNEDLGRSWQGLFLELRRTEKSRIFILRHDF